MQVALTSQELIVNTETRQVCCSKLFINIYFSDLSLHSTVISNTTTPTSTVKTSSCSALSNFYDIATNKTYIKTVCLISSPVSYANAAATCIAAGMTVYDFGPADARSNLLTYVLTQSSTVKYWIQDSTLTATCPRLDFINNGWKENTNAVCTDTMPVFCEFKNTTRNITKN